MDSEHRHELEENALARWLSETYEERKPQLLLVGVGAAAMVLMAAALNWQSSISATARAEEWQDYARAFDSAQPNLPMLQRAAENNPGTPVQEWSEATWADGQLAQASNAFFRDRELANASINEAIETYERLLRSSDRLIAGRSAFQLARAYELQGDLEKAREQYGRVTGAFADLARARSEQLESQEVIDAYAWIDATSTGTVDPGSSFGTDGALEPDEIPMPEITSEEAEATLESLLGESDGEPLGEDPLAEDTDDAVEPTPPADPQP